MPAYLLCGYMGLFQSLLELKEILLHPVVYPLRQSKSIGLYHLHSYGKQPCIHGEFYQEEAGCTGGVQELILVGLHTSQGFFQLHNC